MGRKLHKNEKCAPKGAFRYINIGFNLILWTKSGGLPVVLLLHAVVNRFWREFYVIEEELSVRGLED